MTITKFNNLDENDKYQTTWDLGIYVDSVINNKHCINLYAIDKFFVEVYYNSDSNKIINILSFEQGKSLEKYSGNINF